MTRGPRQPAPRVGLLRVRDHCLVSWQQGEQEDTRTVEINSSHCEDCTNEVRRLGYVLVQKGAPGSRDKPR